MSENTLAPPPLPDAQIDALLGYSDYVFSAYVIVALVLGILVVRTFSRARKAQISYNVVSSSDKAAS